MSHVNVVRAWKDEEYRNSLTTAERAALPESPAGTIDLTAAELEAAGGGWLVPAGIVPQLSFACGTTYNNSCGTVVICVAGGLF
jgi:mersacidin/lichenicidin family type 2 lantibiotic